MSSHWPAKLLVNLQVANGVETTVVQQGGTKSDINERFDMGGPPFTRHQTGAGQRDKRKREEYKNPKDAYCAPIFASLLYMASLAFLEGGCRCCCTRWHWAISMRRLLTWLLVIQPAHPITPHLPSGTPRNKMIVRKRESSCWLISPSKTVLLVEIHQQDPLNKIIVRRREDRERDIQSLHHCAGSGIPDGTMAEGVVDKDRACSKSILIRTCNYVGNQFWSIRGHWRALAENWSIRRKGQMDAAATLAAQGANKMDSRRKIPPFS